MAGVTATLISRQLGDSTSAAVNSGHALDAALGYDINPLLAFCWWALAAGGTSVRLQTGGDWAGGGGRLPILDLDSGRFPWVALSLTVTFGCTPLAKKRAPIAAQPRASCLRVLILLAPALAYLGLSDQ